VLQRMAVLQAVPDQGESTDPEWAEVTALAAQLPPDETQLLYSLCLHGRAELGLAPDEYAALTMVLLRLLAFKKPGPAAAAAPVPPTERAGGAVEPPKKPQPERLATRQATAQTAPVAVAALPPAPPPSLAPVAPAPTPPWESEPEHMRADAAEVQDLVPPTATSEPLPSEQAVHAQAPVTQPPTPPQAAQAPTFQTTALGEVWAGWVQRLLAAELVAALPRELALQSELVGQEGGHWTLRVEHQSLQHPASTEKLLLALQSLDAAAPQQLVVELGSVSDSLARRLAAAQAERQRLAQEIIDNDVFVQDMRQSWGARIVPGSVKPWSASQVAPQPA
jgi:DNA polymerase-3 subunit gamma/tau